MSATTLARPTPPSPQPPQHPGGAGRRCCSRCASTCGSSARTRCSPRARCCAPRSATSASATCRRWSSPRWSARSPRATSLTVPLVTPHLFAFAGALLAGRAAVAAGHPLPQPHRRVRHRAALRSSGMDELLAKDAAFFHENFAGSLTKRVLSFASEFEDFVDTLAFQHRREPRAAGVRVGGALAVRPAAGRRAARRSSRSPASPSRRSSGAGRRWWTQREASWARLSGHVADTLTNMDAVRAYAVGAPRGRRAPAAGAATTAGSRCCRGTTTTCASTRSSRRSRSWPTWPGWLLAVVVASRMGTAGVAAVVVTFAYYVQATKILFDFNQIYRQLERTLTEAAQFAELLLDPPTVLDPESPGAAGPRGRRAWCSSGVRFTHAGDARAAVRRARPAHRRRRAGRPRRPLRRRQDVDRAAAPAADGRRRRPDPGRRPGHHPAVAGRPARADRLRPAGPGDVPPHDRGEHRVRPAGRDRRRDPGGGRRGARHRVRRGAAAAASTRSSASAA